LGQLLVYAGEVTFGQSEFAIRCEWGLSGMRELAPISDIVIIVDVLSLEIATSRGAIVFPYPLKGEAAASYATTVEAKLAAAGRQPGFSLSPASLQDLPTGYRLVLPSPNGAALSCAAGHPVVMAAGLRNARAVARMASRLGSTYALIPAGETWASGQLRPGVEDLIGAGAVIACLPGTRSSEAELAVAGFERFREDLPGALRNSSSGKELIERGFALDVSLAAEYDVNSTVPRLIDGAFVGS
jgi:2-phosphosulfolactate phosphatase